MAQARTIWVSGALLTLLSGVIGCSGTTRDDGINVAQAWANPSPEGQAGPSATGVVPPAPHAGLAPTAGATIALVDGRPIARSRVVDLLLRGHGVGVLEQIIVLQGAERELAVRGLTVTQADFEAEYDRALRRLLSTLPAEETIPVDRAAGERVLERILSSRNISRAEYRIGIRRNACLRKIVEHEMHFAEAQLAAEFERAYGERVKVRHIQLASFAEADRIKRRLDAGEDFAELARDYSANPNTASAGGLLRVFSQEDEDVPALMRQTAFSLEPGAHSAPLKIDQWYHLLKVEERYPAGQVAFQEVRDELRGRLRERLTEPAMQQLHQTLLRQAEVDILDPVLADEFRRKRQPENP